MIVNKFMVNTKYDPKSLKTSDIIEVACANGTLSFIKKGGSWVLKEGVVDADCKVKKG